MRFVNRFIVARHWPRERLQQHVLVSGLTAWKTGIGGSRCYSAISVDSDKAVHDEQSTLSHVPVMLAEVVEHLQPCAGGRYCDATFGAGGYTRAILDAAADCTVFAIDRDPTSIARAHKQAQLAEYRGRLIPIAGRFGNMMQLLAGQLGTAKLDGIVLDIGASSMQFDDPERGFSYRWNGPLDMRMDNTGCTETAADIINSLDGDALARVFSKLGEERHSRVIARAIERQRETAPILDTAPLAQLILDAVRGRSIDPYRSVARIFQSLRIMVNDELGELVRGLEAAEQLLRPGGKLVVVTFHSLEDQLVKDYLYRCSGRRPLTGRSKDRVRRKHTRELKENGSEQRAAMLADLQQLSSETVPSFNLPARKAARPSAQEIAKNSRSASAKLRYAIRTDTPPCKPKLDLVR